jgi:hypothetical protein
MPFLPLQPIHLERNPVGSFAFYWSLVFPSEELLLDSYTTLRKTVVQVSDASAPEITAFNDLDCLVTGEIIIGG